MYLFPRGRVRRSVPCFLLRKIFVCPLFLPPFFTLYHISRLQSRKKAVPDIRELLRLRKGQGLLVILIVDAVVLLVLIVAVVLLILIVLVVLIILLVLVAAVVLLVLVIVLIAHFFRSPFIFSPYILILRSQIIHNA